MVFGYQKVQHAEAHFDLSGQLEISAIKVQTKADLPLQIVFVELDQHLIGAFGLLLLVGDQVQAVLYTTDNINADIVHSGRFDFESLGRIQVNGCH